MGSVTASAVETMITRAPGNRFLTFTCLPVICACVSYLHMCKQNSLGVTKL
jgi:hypothetical protein